MFTLVKMEAVMISDIDLGDLLRTESESLPSQVLKDEHGLSTN